jgi:hypothetical protein
MPAGLSVTNQQSQLGLGFPAPPSDPSSISSINCNSRVAEYRTLKERRLFGRSKGYRDLTLAGAEAEKPAERYKLYTSSRTRDSTLSLEIC